MSQTPKIWLLLPSGDDDREKHKPLYVIWYLHSCLKYDITLHHIVVINVFKEKNLNHFARVKRNRKDAFSVDV